MFLDRAGFAGNGNLVLLGSLPPELLNVTAYLAGKTLLGSSSSREMPVGGKHGINLDRQVNLLEGSLGTTERVDAHGVHHIGNNIVWQAVIPHQSLHRITGHNGTKVVYIPSKGMGTDVIRHLEPQWLWNAYKKGNAISHNGT